MGRVEAIISIQTTRVLAWQALGTTLRGVEEPPVRLKACMCLSMRKVLMASLSMAVNLKPVHSSTCRSLLRTRQQLDQSTSKLTYSSKVTFSYSRLLKASSSITFILSVIMGRLLDATQ